MLLLLLTWLALLSLLTRSLPDTWRRPLRWLPPLTVLAATPALACTPVERLAGMSVFLLYALKATTLLGWTRQRTREMDPLGLALYFSIWPGMDPAPFTRRDAEISLPGRWFVTGWITMVSGAVAFCALALLHLRSGWLSLACILGIVHLGYSDVLSAMVRWAGFPVARLFTFPFASRGLRDFWSRRWNGPFVEMNRLLFVPLFSWMGRRRAVLAAFLLSGLLHEIAISYPAGSGWGGPLLYFVIQGLAMQREPRRFRRLYAWIVIGLPLPLLFPTAFREQLILLLFDALQAQPWLGSWASCKAQLLWWAGCGHFLVLAASFQVPTRLGWHEELQRLRPLNRKLLWVYGGFIAGLIVAFGVMILKLHALMLAGDAAARAVVALIALFWTARLVVDALVFEHSDWPSGAEFAVGHTLLTSLFLYIALTLWLVLLA